MFHNEIGGAESWTLRDAERHILVIAFVVEKDMMVLAVMQENVQEGLRAGRGRTR